MASAITRLLCEGLFMSLILQRDEEDIRLTPLLLTFINNCATHFYLCILIMRREMKLCCEPRLSESFRPNLIAVARQ